MQLKEKPGINLSCGVPSHAVKGKVRNIPELWHSSPCSYRKSQEYTVPELWRSSKSQEYTWVVAFQSMQWKKKSRIYLSLWRSSPCSYSKGNSGIYLSCGVQPMQLKEKSVIYLRFGVTVHAVNGKVRNIPELWRYRKSRLEYTWVVLCYSIPCSLWKSQEYINELLRSGKSSQEYTWVVLFHPMQFMEKSGIYLICGVPSHAVNGKVRNIPELWRSTPCS